MEIRQLQLYICLTEERSFTRAALKMGVVQSTVSNMLRDLETELGTALILRTTRRIEITPKGVEFLRYAKEVLRTLQAGVEAVKPGERRIEGRLEIGVLQCLGPYLSLANLIERFRSQYPGFQLSARTFNNTNAVPSRVRAGKLDLAFFPVLGEETWPGVHFKEIARDPLTVACSVAHDFPSGKPLTIADLRGEHFVDLSRERRLRQLVDSTFLEVGVKRKTVFEINDEPTAVELVQAGLGIMILPKRLAGFYNALGRMKVVPLFSETNSQIPEWRVGMVWKATRRGHEDQPLQRLIEFVGELAN